jgi:hypothetical protein
VARFYFMVVVFEPDAEHVMAASSQSIFIGCTIANAMKTRQAVMNILCWVLIAVLAAATLRWIVWANHQPRPHSIWGEPSEKPLN